MEEWKDIKGYEGLYQISSNGRVRSFHYNKWNIITSHITGKTNHLKIGLYKNKKRKRFYIHKLVAEAFIPNPNNYIEVNHKDENPLNNSVENLEWCTHNYNMNYGTCQERSRSTHLDRTPSILMYDTSGNLKASFNSVIEAEHLTGIPHSNIIACCKERLKTTKEHIFVYGFDSNKIQNRIDNLPRKRNV